MPVVMCGGPVRPETTAPLRLFASTPPTPFEPKVVVVIDKPEFVVVIDKPKVVRVRC